MMLPGSAPALGDISSQSGKGKMVSDVLFIKGSKLNVDCVIGQCFNSKAT